MFLCRHNTCSLGWTLSDFCWTSRWTDKWSGYCFGIEVNLVIFVTEIVNISIAIIDAPRCPSYYIHKLLFSALQGTFISNLALMVTSLAQFLVQELSGTKLETSYCRYSIFSPFITGRLCLKLCSVHKRVVIAEFNSIITWLYSYDVLYPTELRNSRIFRRNG